MPKARTPTGWRIRARRPVRPSQSVAAMPDRPKHRALSRKGGTLPEAAPNRPRVDHISTAVRPIRVARRRTVAAGFISDIGRVPDGRRQVTDYSQPVATASIARVRAVTMRRIRQLKSPRHSGQGGDPVRHRPASPELSRSVHEHHRHQEARPGRRAGAGPADRRICAGAEARRAAPARPVLRRAHPRRPDGGSDRRGVRGPVGRLCHLFRPAGDHFRPAHRPARRDLRASRCPQQRGWRGG